MSATLPDTRPDDAPPAPRPPSRWRALGRGTLEILVVFDAYLLYSWLRMRFTGSPGTAFANARRVVDLERALGLYHELWFQQRVLGARWLVGFWNTFYGTAHFVVPVVALVLLYRRAPQQYPRWRNTFLALMVIALVAFWAFPLAPPRLMPPGYGFVDTTAHYFTFGANEYVPHHQLSAMSARAIGDAYGNVFAAMPSLHIAWATFAALGLLKVLRGRVTRVLAAAYPFAMLVAITITGKHWLLDALGGLVALGVAWAVAGAFERRRQTAFDPLLADSASPPVASAD